jgi:hypothetical protein
MNLVAIADLACRPIEAVLGFEQHGFGVPVLRIRCNRLSTSWRTSRCPGRIIRPFYLDGKENPARR